MQQVLDYYQYILDNGCQHPDRTGEGRISVHGYLMRFNLKEGFPLMTTKQVFVRGIFEELLWFIRGSTDNQELKDKNVGIWDDWALSQETIDKHLTNLVDANATTEEEANTIKAGLLPYYDKIKGTIGNLYGKSWRAAPNMVDRMMPVLSDVNYELFPTLLKDKKEQVIRYAQETIIKNHDVSFEEYYNSLKLPDKNLLVKSATNFTIDQLGDVIHSLKTKPFSSRHVISAWIPEWIPDESISPQQNVIRGKGSLAPCHCLFQFHVTPAKKPGEKHQLSCQLYQR